MNNELYHHGIKGQKWGVRRFQNSDGSLTGEGKKRYKTSDINKANDSVKSMKKAVDTVNTKRQSKSASKKIKSDLSNMSDQELRDVVNRLNMEERYTQVMSSRYASSGKSKVDTILQYGGAALAATSSVLTIMAAINDLK